MPADSRRYKPALQAGAAGKMQAEQAWRHLDLKTRIHSTGGDGLRRTTAENAAWLTGSALLLRAVSMVFQVWLSNRLGAAGLGLLQLVLTAGSLFLTLAMAGGRIATMYLIARANGQNDHGGVCLALRVCLRYALCVSVLAAVLFRLLAPGISRHFVQDAAALPSLRAYALLLPGTCLSAVMSGCCTALGRIRRQVLVELLERLVSIGLTFFLLLLADGDTARSLQAVVLGACAPPFLSFFLLCLLNRAELLGRCGRPGRPMLRSLLRISLPLALGDLLRAGLNSVEQFLIPYGLARSGSRQLALAAYGTIHGMVFPVLLFPCAILHGVSDLLVPMLSKAAVRGQTVRIRSLTERCLQLGALFAAVVFGLIGCCAGELGRLLYRSEAAGDFLRLFSPMVLFLYLDAIVDGMLKGLGQQVHTVRYNTLTNVIDVLGLYLLLPRFGIGGYVLTYTLSHLVNCFLSLRRLLLASDARPSLHKQAGLLGLAVLCALAASLLPSSALIPSLVFRSGSYLLLFLPGCRLLKLLPVDGPAP